MTAFLYRLGRLGHAHPWRVVAAWVLLLLAFCVAGFGFGGKLADSFTIPGTESQAALDRLDAVFPQAAGGSAQAILVAPAGSRIDGTREKAAIGDMVSAITRIDGIESASSPFSTYSTKAVSDDSRAAIISVQFSKADSSVTAATKDALQRTGSIARAAGLSVAFSGQAFQQQTVGVGVTEGLGLLFAGAVLVVTFGSLLAAGLPLLSAVIGVVLSYAAIRLVALFTDVSTSAPTLALMLGLAVGIDYGLFIISRHREQLATGTPVEESIPTAVATAGTAVAFAGTTVIIALLGLLIVGIPFLSIMGVGAAFAVLVAVAASVSLLPAVLALGGSRFVPKPGSRTARRAEAAVRGDVHTMGARWVALVAKAPVVAVVAVVAVLGVLAIPAASLELSLPNNGSQPVGSSSRTAYDLTAKEFGPGRNGPLLILADVTQNNDFITALDRMKARIAALPDVAAVGTPTPNRTLDSAILQVIPSSGPASPTTIRLVQRIRALEPDFRHDYRIPIAVTGTTAVQIDISTRLGNALLPFGLVVVGLSVLLLMAVFRSLVVPLKAAVGFLLSLLASIGVTVAIFQWGWFGGLGTQPGPLLSFLPVLVIAILFGLSMDYEVFLVAGMRETWVHSRDASFAVRRGFTQGARVVTAAALIMVFVFASFIPEGGGTIKPIASSLAVGIVFDAFLVRMTLVPAVMLLFRRAAWYLPRWLDRLLPSVDIEGEGLVRHREQLAWAAGEQDWLVSAAGLVPEAPFTTAPFDLRVRRGEVATLPVPAGVRRGVVATLTGHLLPGAGELQVDGHPAPTEAADVRRLAAPVLDDGTATAVPVGELIAERLRAAPRRQRSGSTGLWLERIRLAVPALGPGPRALSGRTPLGALLAEERLVVLAAAALAGGAELVVIDAGDIGADAERRLALALRTLADDGATAVLVTAAADPAAATPTLPLRKVPASS
ncbi:MMPL family transporter [Amnibacterium sp. CER49]|uniref:MMPL family transporter n=1 Tax=Amnibacterium sp. CER49 TaxID=3039161 RepID=UPI00244C3CA1|nr:MMPL family transporter [Amnibacterium sp. CER49]MDH2442906.1 MMPL family transporter [Amnibacterium sp. CER49]